MNAKSKLNSIDISFINQMANNSSSESVNQVLNRSGRIQSIVRKISSLRVRMDDINVVLDLIHCWYLKKYRKIPARTIFALVAALLYVVSPIDVIPDFIPVVGYIDDAKVLMICLDSVRADLNDFRTWRAFHPVC